MRDGHPAGDPQSSQSLCIIPTPRPLLSDPIKSEEFDQIPFMIISYPHIWFHAEKHHDRKLHFASVSVVTLKLLLKLYVFPQCCMSVCEVSSNPFDIFNINPNILNNLQIICVHSTSFHK